ncbi:hypothetical protein [Kribbia dieselivorans]|uniref:hypothetical protein n=1 Tax=Kribbia dieselivorans TaxID=331526 RepID=UPI000838A2FB|nr:hypothetical protein [Kribbia dieselivorans]
MTPPTAASTIRITDRPPRIVSTPELSNRDTSRPAQPGSVNRTDRPNQGHLQWVRSWRAVLGWLPPGGPSESVGDQVDRIPEHRRAREDALAMTLMRNISR